MIEPLTPSELKAWLDDETRESPVVIDVREAWEHALAKVDAALHIPMQTVPARLAELDAGQPHVLMCHHGMRSFQVAQFLKSQGFDRVYNLTGGIDAWAEEVDPGARPLLSHRWHPPGRSGCVPDGMDVFPHPRRGAR